MSVLILFFLVMQVNIHVMCFLFQCFCRTFFFCVGTKLFFQICHLRSINPKRGDIHIRIHTTGITIMSNLYYPHDSIAAKTSGRVYKFQSASHSDNDVCLPEMEWQ